MSFPTLSSRITDHFLSGAIAIAPSDPNVVWVGTGESFIRSDVSLGNGVYKSTDAGKTWTPMGLEKTGRIARVVTDPRIPDVVFVAAPGTSYGPQPQPGGCPLGGGGAPTPWGSPIPFWLR